jgi:phosphate transport system substrate-binding protein
VRSFFTSRDLIRDVGYIELPPELYDLAERHFSERRLGTAFEHDGSQVGMTIEELLARER